MIGQLNNLYDHHCEDCGGLLVQDLGDNDDDWDNIYEEIAAQLLSDKGIKVNADLHLQTAGKLISAVNSGLGEPDSEDKKRLAEKLKQNIYAFSAAKSFTQMQYYRDAMMGEDGTILSKGSFIKKIADTGEIFNKKFLEAEYENAHYSAIMADKWDRFGEEEYLQYSTVGDRNVRPSHAALDKYTAPKSDSFWKNNYPPNGWGCRCTVVPGKETHRNTITPKEAGAQLKEENRNTPFYNNVGASKVIFRDNHPYFINANGEEKNLSWEQYGLPDLDKIRTNELPEYQPKTKEDYLEWWRKQPKIKGDDIIVNDVLSNKIILPSGEGKGGKESDFFKHHVLKKENDNRHEYATETIDILKNPDEVWYNPKDKNTKVYLRYYEQGTMKVVVNENNIAETMFLIEHGDKSEANKIGLARKGILLHK